MHTKFVQMLEDNDNYLKVDILSTSSIGGMCSVEDSDGAETASANHHFGSQLLAQVQ